MFSSHMGRCAERKITSILQEKKNIRILESSIFSENKKIKIILTFSCKSPTTPPLKKEKETIGGTSLGPHDMDDDG
jgi:hypothetical protein